MHPGFVAWWHARGGGCGRPAFSGPRHGGPGAGGGPGPDDFAGPPDGGFGGPFGVRRPLRFLAYKLELDERQVAELATILDDLKTERAQAAVDQRRTTSAFADAVSADAFDAAKVEQIRADRVKSHERLQAAVGQALGRIHALLDAEQRKKLAYLLRTGAISL